MLLRVVTASRSPRISAGLTYESATPIAPGTAVSVPLRRSVVEGIVTEVLRKREEGAYALKQITGLLGSSPLLTPAQMLTLQWISDHYCCGLRQALAAALPPPPWKHLLSVEPDASPAPKLIPPPLSERSRRSLEAMMQSTAPTLLWHDGGLERLAMIAHAIAGVINSGKQVLLLTPEIAQADQREGQITALLPAVRCAIMSGDPAVGARRALWRRVRSGSVDLVIGTRSALFAPLPRLGLLIVEGEEDPAHKSERAPRLHTRDAAEILCRHVGAKLVVMSSAPSLEAWKKTEETTWHIVHVKSEDPKNVRIIDLGAAKSGSRYPFTASLIAAIEERLRKREQVALVLNRRGLGAVLCRDCRRQMPHPAPKLCPHCGGTELHDIGAGTQRVERTLATLFPAARVLRADKDIVARPRELHTVLDAMRNRKADILVGTQMILPALELPGISLACVLVADAGLSLPHFRASERVAQLLQKIRARQPSSAELIIQTFRPDAPEIIAAQTGDYASYLRGEAALRRSLAYPPFAAMVRIVFKGEDAETRARDLQTSLLRRALESGSDVKVTNAPAMKRDTTQILLRGTDPRALLTGLIGSDMTVDVDPLETL